MHQQFIILIGIMLLAMGTYLIRYAGLSLSQYFTITQQQEQLFNDAATTLLFSIAILSTFFEGADWADLGKIMGVLVGLFLIWKNHSLVTTIVIAMLTTTIFRFAEFFWLAQ